MTTVRDQLRDVLQHLINDQRVDAAKALSAALTAKAAAQAGFTSTPPAVSEAVRSAPRGSVTRAFEPRHTAMGQPPARSTAEPWRKARAFDKVNPKTGARPDRSVLRTGSGKYHAIEGSNEGDYIQVHVYRDDIDSGNYHGINVLFMADGKVEKSTADKWADEQWYEDKDKIIAVARRYVGAAKIAAFVKRGGDAGKRKPDDWDNGFNDIRDEDRVGRRVKTRVSEARPSISAQLDIVEPLVTAEMKTVLRALRDGAEPKTSSFAARRCDELGLAELDDGKLKLTKLGSAYVDRFLR